MTDLAEKFRSRRDLHQSPTHAAVMADIGWQTIKVSPGSNLFLRRLGPLALAKLQRPREIDLKLLRPLRRRYHTLLTYLEPGLVSDPLPPGIRVEPFAHSNTSLLDLSLSESELLASFNQSVRRRLRSSRDKDLELSAIPLSQLTTADLGDFFSLHRSWTKLRRVTGYPQAFIHAVLRRHAQTGSLHLAKIAGVPAALLLVLTFDRVATYYIAFSTPTGYTHACPTLLTWEALKLAKKQGCDIFDFGGIYDPRYPHLYKNWQGFTKFKESFRPTVVTYPPTTLQLFW